ncbi:MAG: ExbD/TolR family protein, partial [Gammaproteobacteria bacterium]
TREPAIISIDKAGNYYLNFGDDPDKPVSAQVLVNRVGALLKYRDKLPVLVKGDVDVPYGRVVEIMALLQLAGVDGIGLVTDTPER